jgi:hypothetical protein
VPNSGSAPGSGTTLAVTKKSGPVPNENVAAVTVVAAVTPERVRRTVSVPTVKGLNIPLVIDALPFVKLPPEGRSNWLGCPPPIASSVTVFPEILGGVPVPPEGPCPTKRPGDPDVVVTTPPAPTFASWPEALADPRVPAALLRTKLRSLTVWPTLMMALGLSRLLSEILITPSPVVKVASAAMFAESCRGNTTAFARNTELLNSSSE